MPRYTTKLPRLAVLGLSVAALLPATAAAMPINDGQAPTQQAVAGGGDVVSGHGYKITVTPSKPFTGGGDVVSAGGYQVPATVVNGPPSFPTNTTSLPRRGASNPTAASAPAC
jgi:hypothetical protein